LVGRLHGDSRFEGGIASAEDENATSVGVPDRLAAEGDAMSKLNFIRVQDRHLSLWQSAVAKMLHEELGVGGSPTVTLATSDHPLATGVNAHVASVIAGEKLKEPSAALDETALFAYLSQLAFQKGQALVEGDAERAAAIDAAFRPFSDNDPGFLKCAAVYAWYFTNYQGKFLYNDWTIAGGGNINYGMIGWQLPNDAKVGIIGDWGTGLDDARWLLNDLVQLHSPNAIIHLGDIYYSATPDECQANFVNPIREVLAAFGENIPVFTLAGNHDYYALGYGFLPMLAQLNPNVPTAAQQASYFCLRTQDGGWQFLGMDTGLDDANPGDQFNPFYAGPTLKATEITWLQDKMDDFAGGTVLLSHHQLFTANAKINGSTSAYRDLPYLNPFLYDVFGRYFSTDVGAWLWGHEHNFVMYRNGLFGLASGRLLGASAYEEAQTANPYQVNNPEVPYFDPVKYQLPVTSDYYDHSYSVIDLSHREQPTDPVTITHYSYPSWYPTAPPSPTSTAIFSERIMKPQLAPSPPVYFGDLITLVAEEGLPIGALYHNIYSYPTLEADTVSLRLQGGSGQVTHNAHLQIATTESAAGSSNILGAWATPSLYYYSGGYVQQNWTIVKEDPADPVVHVGDRVCFVNQHYAGSYMSPLWSKLWAAIYLTTQTARPYYWTVGAAVANPPAGGEVARGGHQLAKIGG
jgi:hypothetical protein